MVVPQRNCFFTKFFYKNCDVLPPEENDDQNCRRKEDLVFLIRQRNVQTQSSLHRKSVAELVDLLTKDDEEKAHAEKDELDQMCKCDLNPAGGALEPQIDEEIRIELFPTSSLLFSSSKTKTKTRVWVRVQVRVSAKERRGEKEKKRTQK